MFSRSVPLADAALVARARVGDAAAYDQLVARHIKDAFAAAYRVLLQREDAEDIVQESFVAALAHLDSFDTAREFRPWLLRIVVNRALNARKQRERRRTEPLPEDAVAATGAPSARVEQRELQEHLREALAGLPERQRLIVQLSAVEGMTSTDIGELLQLPAGTVRWELHEARRALRATLAVCKGSES